jgi:hypothetical protein
MLLTLGFAAGVASFMAGCITLPSKRSTQDLQAQQAQPVQETGQGTYSIPVIQSHGIGAAGRQEKATNDAIDKAGAYCHAKELKLSIIPSASQSLVTFRCLSE